MAVMYNLKPGRRGVPALVTVRATELADLENEARASRDETVATLIDIRRHAGRVHLAVVADRPDLALHAAGQITSLAERRLRQITGEAAS